MSRRAACTLALGQVRRREMWSLLKEFLSFLRQEKKWWILPLVFLLLALGALMVLSSGSVLSPFLYPLM